MCVASGEQRRFCAEAGCETHREPGENKMRDVQEEKDAEKLM